jgi:hypothetical protein
MSRKLVSLITASLLLAGLVVLGTAQSSSVSLTGPIVDKACSARFTKASDPQTASAAHTRKCALMENCSKSGYGVFADGKYYEFDEKGNELAKTKIEASKKDSGAKYKVEGSVDGSKLMVKSISEIE